MNTIHKLTILFLFGSVLPATAQTTLTDRATALGIDFTWSAAWTMGDFGTGVALEDLDLDGDLDLIVGSKTNTPLKVYRNDGTTFADISDQVGVGDPGDVKQVLSVDLDNDGRRDLLLSGWKALPGNPSEFTGGWLRVYRANAGASFVDRSPGSGIEAESTGLPTGVAAGDYDHDGDLDLYVSYWKVGPADATSRNRLYRNDGNFAFSELGVAAGVASTKKSYQPVFSDLDGDGWCDLVVAQDKGGGITYYQNDRDGSFSDRSSPSGLDGFRSGADRFVDGMGVAIGDYNRDGNLDVYVTNILDGNVFYRNLGGGQFEEIAQTNGTLSQRIGWGTAFLDCDNDGWLDLYVVDFGGGGMGDNTDRLYLNQRFGSFTDIAASAGLTFTDDGFGMARGDLDGNGASDVVVTAGGAPLRVLMNETTAGHWLQVDLEGSSSNRDGIGARVKLLAGGMIQHREQRAGGSYLSSHAHALGFGLGDLTLVDRLVVRWPSGIVDVWTDVAADQRLHLVEGTGTGSVAARPAPSLSARRTTDGVELSWSVDPAVAWEHFRLLERLDGGVGRELARLAAVDGQSRYRYVDRDPLADRGRLYQLVATLSGEDVENSTLRVGAATRRRVLDVAPAWPNPFNPRTVLRYRARAGRPVRLRILDSKGRVVRSFERGSNEDAVDGWRRLVWDGDDDRGRPVASGSYRFVVQSGGAIRSTSLSLVR